MDQTEIERLIGDLEIAVDRVRSLYEQYFMGIEKLEPTVPRKDIDRRIHILRKEQIRNTALRFRFQMVLQRYNTYQTHWQRICRDIENGTYKRHVIRALRRFGSKRPSQRPPSAAPKPERTFADELAELDREFAPAELLNDKDVELEEEAPTTRRPPLAPRAGGTARPPPPSPRTLPPRPTRPPAGRTVAPPRPPPSSRVNPRPVGTPSSRPPASPRAPAPAGRAASSSQQPRTPMAPPRRAPDLPEERVRQLYAQYIETRRRQNESTATITYEAVARSLQESGAKLRQRLGKPVDFEVTVKDGRAIIRPVVK